MPLDHLCRNCSCSVDFLSSPSQECKVHSLQFHRWAEGEGLLEVGRFREGG